MSELKQMKPVVILPKGAMSKEDIQRLNDNDFVVVEAEAPEDVRFCEPPAMGYSVQERAAISLCRYLMSNRSYNLNFGEISSLYAQFIIRGSPLEQVKGAKK